MMIEHIAIWTDKLEELREFYCRFFGGSSNDMYVNEKKGFKSYFISFGGGARLELMSSVSMAENTSQPVSRGLAHFAFSAADASEVDSLTGELIKNGVTLNSAPRVTGDGYYESSFLDPDGNLIEICAAAK